MKSFYFKRFQNESFWFYWIPFYYQYKLKTVNLQRWGNIHIPILQKLLRFKQHLTKKMSLLFVVNYPGIYPFTCWWDKSNIWHWAHPHFRSWHTSVQIFLYQQIFHCWLWMPLTHPLTTSIHVGHLWIWKIQNYIK